jgi:hypothetical protein
MWEVEMGKIYLRNLVEFFFFRVWSIKRNNSKLYQIPIYNYVIYLVHTSFILVMEIPVKQLVVNKYLKYLYYGYLIHI